VHTVSTKVHALLHDVHKHQAAALISFAAGQLLHYGAPNNMMLLLSTNCSNSWGPLQMLSANAMRMAAPCLLLPCTRWGRSV
jgi:hypothetical protein